MREDRRKTPYELNESQRRKERESENGTTKQKDAKSNGCQLKMSHADQHAHDKNPSQRFPKKPRTHGFPSTAPSSEQATSYADSKQPKAAVPSHCLAGILPID